MLILKQSTAVDVLVGPFLDLTDAATSEEGETIEDEHVLLSKNGQGLAAKAETTTLTHDNGGYYNCMLGTGDTDTVGTLVLIVEKSANALPIRHEFQVVEEATYDYLYASGATPIADINAEVDTALTDYDPPTATELIAEIDAVQTDIAALNDPDVTAIADAIWDEARSGHVADGSYGEMLQALASGTAVGGSGASIVLDEPAALPFVGNVVQITGGTGTGQARVILAESGVTAIVNPNWDTAPDATSKYVIHPFGPALVQSWTAVAIATMVDTMMRNTTATTEVQPGGTPSHRTLYGVIAALMHKAERDGGDSNIILYESDDSTVLVTIPITKDSGLDPIQGIDPPA